MGAAGRVEAVIGNEGRGERGGPNVEGSEGVPLLRGLGRFGESLLVLAQVKIKLPQAELPLEGGRVAGALVAAAAATSTVKALAPKTALVQETGMALAAFVPAVLALKNSPISGYHGAEHKVIGGREAALRSISPPPGSRGRPASPGLWSRPASHGGRAGSARQGGGRVCLARSASLGVGKCRQGARPLRLELGGALLIRRDCGHQPARPRALRSQDTRGFGARRGGQSGRGTGSSALGDKEWRFDPRETVPPARPRHPEASHYH